MGAITDCVCTQSLSAVALLTADWPQCNCGRTRLRDNVCVHTQLQTGLPDEQNRGKMREVRST